MVHIALRLGAEGGLLRPLEHGIIALAIAMGRVSGILGQHAVRTRALEPVSFTPLIGSDTTGFHDLETVMCKVLDNCHARWYTWPVRCRYERCSTALVCGVPVQRGIEEGP